MFHFNLRGQFVAHTLASHCAHKNPTSKHAKTDNYELSSPDWLRTTASQRDVTLPPSRASSLVWWLLLLVMKY